MCFKGQSKVITWYCVSIIDNQIIANKSIYIYRLKKFLHVIALHFLILTRPVSFHEIILSFLVSQP